MIAFAVLEDGNELLKPQGYFFLSVRRELFDVRPVLFLEHVHYTANK